MNLEEINQNKYGEYHTCNSIGGSEGKIHTAQIIGFYEGVLVNEQKKENGKTNPIPNTKTACYCNGYQTGNAEKMKD